MKTWILLCYLLFCSAACFCQDSLKTNPIIFMEGYIGGSVLGASGWNIGLSLNYQYKRNLITIKTTTVADWGYSDDGKRRPDIPHIPPLQNLYNEYAVLYGTRFVKVGHSLSASFGLSHNRWNQYERTGFNTEKFTSTYIGLPYEFTIKWFKKDKERYRILFGLIPVGKPTALGRSYGLKLYGNISKNIFAAIGLASSFGYHKKY